MAYTFYDINKNQKYEVESVEDVDVDKDIITEEVTGYYAFPNGNKVEVSEDVYNKLKEELNLE